MKQGVVLQEPLANLHDIRCGVRGGKQVDKPVKCLRGILRWKRDDTNVCETGTKSSKLIDLLFSQSKDRAILAAYNVSL